ncbi:hypothetical protein [Microbacterium xylanilyticum]
MAPATIAPASSASAVVSQGHGVQGTYGHIGSVYESSTGQYVYCLDSSLTVPFGEESAPSQVSYVPANPNVTNAVDMGPDAAGRVNYVISTWGQTTDDLQSAAVYITALAYQKGGGWGEAVTYAGGRQDVIDLAWSMYQQSQAVTIGGSGSGQVTGNGVLTVDPQNNYKGTVNINGTAGANVTITLTNGVFDSTGTNTLTNATSNTDYAIHGVPPTDDGAPYKISGTFTLKAGSGSVWPASINLYTYSEGAQRMAGALGPVSTEQTINGSFSDPDSRSTVFLPIVKTTAVQFVKKGEKFTDQWNFGTQPDAKGLDNGWYQSPTSGNYAQIPADAVIYGPFKEQPAEAPDAPAGAPVAAHASMTTDLKIGPTKPYTVTSDEVAKESGYYVWQTSITDAKVKDLFKPLIPSPYSWKDAFGQTVESSIVPMTITGSTKVTTPEVALSGVPGDSASIVNDGIWLQNGGKNIDVTVKWDAYWDKTIDGPKQVPASQIPADAVKLGTVTQKVNKPGDIKTPDTAEALGFTAPAAGTGSIVWVLHIDAADNAGMVEDWSDDYGVPSEIQKIAQPTTKTQATPGAKPGTDTKDTAEVDGTLPANGAELTFQQYEVPMVKDTSGKWVINAPKGTAAGDLSWVCTADNEKYSNVGKGQVIVKTGKYDSPNVKITEGKKYLWVEKLWSVPAKPGDKPQLIAEGKCGVPTETTFGLIVTTQAQTSDANSPTPTLHDTGVITGYVPEGGKVVVDAYRGEQCTADTKIWTSKDIALEGGYFPDGFKFETDTFKAESSYTASTVSFWEKVYDASGRLVAQGGCNMPGETVPVKAAEIPLVHTGGDVAPWIAAGSAVILLAAAGIYLVARRRDQRETSTD